MYIPDPGVKKAPDPGPRSATLISSMCPGPNPAQWIQFSLGIVQGKLDIVGSKINENIDI